MVWMASIPSVCRDSFNVFCTASGSSSRFNRASQVTGRPDSLWTVDGIKGKDID